MSGTTPQAPAGAAPNAATAATTAPAAATFTQADVDQARAAGRQEGATAERERASAILGHEAAATNMALAVTCVKTGLSAEQAGAILAAAPKPAELTATANNGFAAVMSAIGNPAVSGIEAAATQGNDEAALAAQIVASFRAAK